VGDRRVNAIRIHLSDVDCVDPDLSSDLGIRQVRRHPYLIVHGGVAAFRKADQAARAAHLSAC
jgi:hypothetical protein